MQLRSWSRFAGIWDCGCDSKHMDNWTPSSCLSCTGPKVKGILFSLGQGGVYRLRPSASMKTYIHVYKYAYDLGYCSCPFPWIVHPGFGTQQWWWAWGFSHWVPSFGCQGVCCLFSTGQTWSSEPGQRALLPAADSCHIWVSVFSWWALGVLPPTCVLC